MVNRGTINYAETCGVAVLFGDGSIDNFGVMNLGDNANMSEQFGTNSIHNEAGGTITGTSTAPGTPGTLSVPLDNDGTITAASGKTLGLQGLHLAGGAGTIGALPGGSVQIVGSVSVDVGASPSVPSGRTLEWPEGGTINGPGALTVATGGTLRLPAQCVNHHFLRGPLVNRGTIDYAATCGVAVLFGDGSIDNFGVMNLGDNTNMSEQFGTNSIHNEAGGTITGNGTGSTVGVPLDNDGSSRARAAYSPSTTSAGTTRSRRR